MVYQGSKHKRTGGKYIISAGIFALLFAFMACAKTEKMPEAFKGIIKESRGESFILREGNKLKVKIGTIVQEGDILLTGTKANLVVVFSNGASEMEIQEKAELKITSFTGSQRDLRLVKGNLWLRVNKLNSQEVFNLKSPTAIAGVRGTKFYTFSMKDPQGRVIHGTCHCEGKVDYTTIQGAKYHAVHKKDYTVFSRAGKTILVSPQEMMAAVPDNAGHSHSKLDKSLLGPKEIVMSPSSLKRFLALLDKKFAEVK